MRYTKLLGIGDDKFRRLIGVKRDTLKSQVVVAQETKQIIGTFLVMVGNTIFGYLSNQRLI